MSFQLPPDDGGWLPSAHGGAKSKGLNKAKVKKDKQGKKPHTAKATGGSGCGVTLPAPDEGIEFGCKVACKGTFLPEPDLGLEFRDLCGPNPHRPTPLLVSPGPSSHGWFGEALMEFFSPPRLAPVARARGLQASKSWDLTCGWDCNKPQHRAEAMGFVESLDPLMCTMSPECTMFSALMRCNESRMCPITFAQRMEIAIDHMNFCMMLCRHRSQRNRLFLLEHPSTASSWRLPSVEDVCATVPNCQVVSFAQCRYGLKSPDGRPMRKLTKFLTNSDAVVAEFNQKGCRCHEKGLIHCKIEGSCQRKKLSKWAQVYPAPLVSAMVSCTERETRNLI